METDRADLLSIVPLARSHFRTISSWFRSARDVAIWAGPSSTYPVDDRQFQVMLNEASQSPPCRIARVATLGSEVVAHAQLAVDRRVGSATLQRVAVSPSQRGRGLAGRFLKQILAEGFSIAEIERIDLLVFPFNTPAIRAYQRLGFIHEGRLRSSMPFETERWDTLLMSILRSEATPAISQS